MEGEGSGGPIWFSNDSLNLFSLWVSIGCIQDIISFATHCRGPEAGLPVPQLKGVEARTIFSVCPGRILALPEKLGIHTVLSRKSGILAVAVYRPSR
jgi:hypothetical protein